MIRRQNDQILVVALALVCSILLGCNQRRQSAALPNVSYFSLMERAFTIEGRGDCPNAIKLYAQALDRTSDAEPNLRNQAKIAVHNRLAACYRSLSKRDEALREFRKSIALGDTRFAPKAIAKLQASRSANDR